MVWFFSFLVFLFLYLVGMNFLVILESSILGLMGISIGPMKLNWKAFYLCVLDFVKLLLKSYYLVSYWKFYIGILLFIELVIFFSFLLLPFSYLSCFCFYYSFLYFLLSYVFISSIKFFVFSFDSEFVFFSGFSLGMFVVILEVIFFVFCGIYFVLFCFLGVVFWGDMVFNISFSVFSFFGVFPLLFLIFLSVLMKISRSPFDFFEAEGEFVGGGVLEFCGFLFIFWSLIEYGFLFYSAGLLCFLGFVWVFDFFPFVISVFIISLVCFVFFCFSGLFVSLKVSFLCGILFKGFFIFVFQVFIFIFIFIFINIF